MVSIQEYKNEFIDRKGIHFNNAGSSPISRSVAERISAIVTRGQIDGSFAESDWVPELIQFRSNFAQFLGADKTEVAFTQNTASAISQVALGFPLKPGDSVVTIDQEYSSSFYPWKVACDRSGAKLVVVGSEANEQLSLEKLKSAIVPGVKLVGVSWVQFQTGAILDLKSLGEHCHSVGAYLVVDVIQGMGQLPFSFKDLPVDFIAGGSHKWLSSPHGQGYFAVKKELMDLIEPLAVGGLSFNRQGMTASLQNQLDQSARRFEPGGMSFILLLGLDSAIQVLSNAGMPAIEAENARLSKMLREGLLAAGVELVTPLNQRGAITSFKLPIEAEIKFLRRCKEEQIAIVKRGDYLRASPHAFCDDEEIDQVLSLVRACRG